LPGGEGAQGRAWREGTTNDHHQIIFSIHSSKKVNKHDRGRGRGKGEDEEEADSDRIGDGSHGQRSRKSVRDRDV
jgi:hypothetical protein